MGNTPNFSHKNSLKFIQFDSINSFIIQHFLNKNMSIHMAPSKQHVNFEYINNAKIKLENSLVNQKI